MNEPMKVLTIGGSDSGGAAGVQADLRAWATLGAYGMVALTAVTAQNSRTINAIEFMSPAFLRAQMDAIFTDYGAAGVKTGFFGRADLIEAAAAGLRQHAPPVVIIDPVLVNHKGVAMFGNDVLQAYKTHLIPQATIVTPNLHEAALLAGMAIEGWDDVKTAVFQIHSLGAKHVLLKGWRDGDMMVDVLFDGQTLRRFTTPIVETDNLHGSGDTLSAAICAFLAGEVGVETAVSRAIAFTHQAIKNGANWQLGQGHGPVWAEKERDFETSPVISTNETGGNLQTD